MRARVHMLNRLLHRKKRRGPADARFCAARAAQQLPPSEDVSAGVSAGIGAVARGGLPCESLPRESLPSRRPDACEEPQLLLNPCNQWLHSPCKTQFATEARTSDGRAAASPPHMRVPVQLSGGNAAARCHQMLDRSALRWPRSRASCWRAHLLLTAVAALQHGLGLRVGHHILVCEEPLIGNNNCLRGSHMHLSVALRCLSIGWHADSSVLLEASRPMLQTSDAASQAVEYRPAELVVQVVGSRRNQAVGGWGQP